MIELKPVPENYFKCPECKSADPAINDVVIQSIHVMADCTCRVCGLQFYQTYPVSHCIDDRLSIGKLNGRLYHEEGRSWLVDAWRKAHGRIREDKVKIERIVLKPRENVVILNTLDYLYGHVLLKLYNAQYHLDQQPHLGLVVIIPKSFEWLIPLGCAEAWVVDLKLGDLFYGYTAIQRFVSQQFGRFRNIYLSKAYSHPDFTRVDITRFTGIEPFDLVNFTRQSPVITFVLREDRWWFAHVYDYWFYRICRRLNLLRWGRRMLSAKQNRLVKKTIKRISGHLPEAEFFIAGLGHTGHFGGYAVDKRSIHVNPAVERDWCYTYAKSHVVVGVHGSNMLLPTAFAAGCVEILPDDRRVNLAQDISVRYNDRRQLFFYRFAGLYATPGHVADEVVAVIRDYDEYNKNMCQNLYPARNDTHHLVP